MTKKFNNGSRNQNSPRIGNMIAGSSLEMESGDNSKGNKRNKDQRDNSDND